jgi:hypothetical protein
MTKEEKLEINLRHKVFLMINKFIPHVIALFYVIYTSLGFCGIDSIIISYIANLSFLPMCYIFINSVIYKYCYVHRLPLYYIALNELITVSDYYLHIPINDFNLLVVHILLLGIFIYGYSFYYIKYRLKYERR